MVIDRFRRIALVAALAVPFALVTAAHGQANAAWVPRTFSCTGSLGEPLTVRTVTGQLTQQGVPIHVVVTDGGATVRSSRTRAATPLGPSWLHAGYAQWGISGRYAGKDVYMLHVPPVLPGNGGFFDADLEIQFNGGSNGNWQIPMFDCLVTGGPSALAHPPGVRTLACTGGLGQAYTFRSVAASISRNNVPSAIAVTATGTGLLVDQRPRAGTLLGPSWLHSGYVQWDVTGHAANGDRYYLHLPPVLPPAGGFTDADLEIEFAGGANGSWQIPMFDCTVS